ncbi:GNAT family N-acetyltransferase [Salinivibrio kushneri]|uniref:GNAT family N-acetyltransferase n=1 Tax=Salinivibrio kushneri TaxID=1908198 RepID=UPI0009893CA6|nr:GNAT family N-acetyltransferase [Salinivibrio kushneri]OOE70824.1 hypothetical protein BZG19_02260 [Salinivibrio kushneri]
MDVRRFVETDREALRNIYFESRRNAFGWLDPNSVRLSDFDRDTENEAIWVAEREGSLIGFVSIYEPENFIHNLFVRPSWIGRGCGSELLTTCLKQLGRPARLKCIAENTKALAFYEARGWNTVGEGVNEEGRYLVLETVKP